MLQDDEELLPPPLTRQESYAGDHLLPELKDISHIDRALFLSNPYSPFHGWRRIEARHLCVGMTVAIAEDVSLEVFVSASRQMQRARILQKIGNFFIAGLTKNENDEPLPCNYPSLCWIDLEAFPYLSKGRRFYVPPPILCPPLLLKPRPSLNEPPSLILSETSGDST